MSTFHLKLMYKFSSFEIYLNVEDLDSKDVDMMLKLYLRPCPYISLYTLVDPVGAAATSFNIHILFYPIRMAL